MLFSETLTHFSIESKSVINQDSFKTKFQLFEVISLRPVQRKNNITTLIAYVGNRKLKQRQRRSRGRHLVKNEAAFAIVKICLVGQRLYKSVLKVIPLK